MPVFALLCAGSAPDWDARIAQAPRSPGVHGLLHRAGGLPSLQPPGEGPAVRRPSRQGDRRRSRDGRDVEAAAGRGSHRGGRGVRGLQADPSALARWRRRSLPGPVRAASASRHRHLDRLRRDARAFRGLRRRGVPSPTGSEVALGYGLPPERAVGARGSCLAARGLRPRARGHARCHAARGGAVPPGCLAVPEHSHQHVQFRSFPRGQLRYWRRTHWTGRAS